MKCPGWTRAVWDIGNGYIFQYHLVSLVQAIYIVCYVLTINPSI